jgi:hypothetical protein
MMHVMVSLDVLQELVLAVGAHVNEFFGASECMVSELCLLVGDLALAPLVTAGTACAHSKQDGDADHCYKPWFWMAQLEDMQSALILELVSSDDFNVAGREVDHCACDSSRDHLSGDAGAMRQEIITIMLSLLLLFCLKKMNWLLYLCPVSAAAACTCLI